MLKHDKYGLLNLKDVNILNTQVVTHLPNSDFGDSIIVMQKNHTRYLINCLQAKNFACSQNIDLILILAKYSWNKKDKGNLIQYKDLFGV